jgi:hypothetical protein
MLGDMIAAPKKWVVICCPVAGKKTAAAVTNDVFVPRMKEVIPDTLVEVIYTTHKVIINLFFSSDISWSKMEEFVSFRYIIGPCNGVGKRAWLCGMWTHCRFSIVHLKNACSMFYFSQFSERV